MTDHGLEYCPYLACDDSQAEAIFKKLRSAQKPTVNEAEQWMT